MGCSHTIIPASEGHLFACPGSRIGSRVRWIRAKAKVNLGGFTGLTVQAEALTPGDLAAEVDAAIRAFIDIEALAAVVAAEAEEREPLIVAIDGLGSVP